MAIRSSLDRRDTGRLLKPTDDFAGFTAGFAALIDLLLQRRRAPNPSLRPRSRTRVRFGDKALQLKHGILGIHAWPVAGQWPAPMPPRQPRTLSMSRSIFSIRSCRRSLIRPAASRMSSMALICASAVSGVAVAGNWSALSAASHCCRPLFPLRLGFFQMPCACAQRRSSPCDAPPQDRVASWRRLRVPVPRPRPIRSRHEAAGRREMPTKTQAHRIRPGRDAWPRSRGLAMRLSAARPPRAARSSSRSRTGRAATRSSRQDLLASRACAAHRAFQAASSACALFGQRLLFRAPGIPADRLAR